jgi:hypothetical protein
LPGRPGTDHDQVIFCSAHARVTPEEC